VNVTTTTSFMSVMKRASRESASRMFGALREQNSRRP
jgi:hypothetical protein